MMKRNFRLHIRWRHAAAFLFVAGCAGGDRDADGSNATLNGFMVPGPRAAEFGLTPGDTLTEQPAGRVPAALRSQTERAVRDADYDLGCTRYFGSGSTVVVYGAKSCGAGTRDAHDWAVALFRQDSDRFVREPRDFEAAMGRVCPRSRDARGRPLVSCE